MSGTRPTEIELSAAEVCTILEASAKAGVTELKFRDLHVSFGKPVEERVITLDPSFVPQPPAPHPSGPDLSEDQHRKQARDALRRDEATLRADQLAEMLVTDPEGYERLLQQGELENAVDSSDSGDDE